jgi:lipopolysaccharide/colanic/teichoic acid biosynthesis glycosyltransferase
MREDEIAAPGKPELRFFGRRALLVILYIGCAVLTAWIIWSLSGSIFARSDLSFVAAVGLGLGYLGFTLALERSLAQTGLPLSWRYRLSFLIGLSLGAVFWLVHWGSQPEPPLFSGIISMALAFCGSFLGGLTATWLNEGMWENNAPPDVKSCAEVEQMHLQIIGAPGRTPAGKRLFDLALSLLAMLMSAPVWGICMLLIWLEDPGPLLFVKNSVGKGGHNFHQYKFRTMVCRAEEHTGPILSSEDDQRVLHIGRFLRKSALDELPQLINILRGEMSFVGPRPQRTVLVYGYLQSMPEYAHRHAVPPGLAGLAQVAGDYFLTPRQKLRFDRIYIRHISLGFDLKLILLACLIAFWFRWQKDWNGRLPRSLIHTRPRP